MSYEGGIQYGTWTPTIQFGGSTSGILYNVQVGYYSKVGPMVDLFMFCQLLTTGSATGSCTMVSPFTFNSSSVMRQKVFVNGVNLTAGYSPIVLLNGGFTQMSFQQNDSMVTPTALTHASFSGTAPSIGFNISFITTG